MVLAHLQTTRTVIINMASISIAKQMTLKYIYLSICQVTQAQMKLRLW